MFLFVAVDSGFLLVRTGRRRPRRGHFEFGGGEIGGGERGRVFGVVELERRIFEATREGI